MNKRVLLGMSGGVDSSVSAILLQKQGYEVIGLTMILWGDDLSNALDAKKVCKKLNIEHTVLDLRNDFKRYVIQDFIVEYRSEHTPNPCIVCNKFMKFGFMFLKAKELNCDYIATGHYAKIEFDDTKSKSKKIIHKLNNIVLFIIIEVLYFLLIFLV